MTLSPTSSLSLYHSIFLSFFLSSPTFPFEGPTFEWPLMRECVCAQTEMPLRVRVCVCVHVRSFDCMQVRVRLTILYLFRPVLTARNSPAKRKSPRVQKPLYNDSSPPPLFPSSSWTVTRKGPVLLWIPQRARFPSSVWSKVAAQSGNIRIIVIRRSLLTIQQTPRDLLLSPAKKHVILQLIGKPLLFLSYHEFGGVLFCSTIMWIGFWSRKKVLFACQKSAKVNWMFLWLISYLHLIDVKKCVFVDLFFISW